MGNGGRHGRAGLAGLAGVVFLATLAVGGLPAGYGPWTTAEAGAGTPVPEARADTAAIFDNLIDRGEDFALFDDDTTWMIFAQGVIARPLDALGEVRDRLLAHREWRDAGEAGCAALSVTPSGGAEAWTLDFGPPGGGCREPGDGAERSGRLRLEAETPAAADPLVDGADRFPVMRARVDDARATRTVGTLTRTEWRHGDVSFTRAETVSVRADLLRGAFTRDTDPARARAGFALDALRCDIDARPAPGAIDLNGACDFGQVFLDIPPDGRAVTPAALATCTRPPGGPVTCPDLDLVGFDGEAARLRVQLTVLSGGCGAVPRYDGFLRLEAPHADGAVTFRWDAATPCGRVMVSRDGGPEVARDNFLLLPPPGLPL